MFAARRWMLLQELQSSIEVWDGLLCRRMLLGKLQHTLMPKMHVYIYISYTYSHMYLDTYIHVCYCMHAFCVRTPQTLCIHGRIKFTCTISSSTSVIIALECKLHRFGSDLAGYLTLYTSIHNISGGRSDGIYGIFAPGRNSLLCGFGGPNASIRSFDPKGPPDARAYTFTSAGWMCKRLS